MSDEKVSPFRFALALGPLQRFAFPPASFFSHVAGGRSGGRGGGGTGGGGTQRPGQGRPGPSQ